MGLNQNITEIFGDVLEYIFNTDVVMFRTEVIKMMDIDEKMQKEMTAGYVKMGIKEDEVTEKMLWGSHKMMYGIAKVKMGLKEIGWDEDKIVKSIGEMSEMMAEQDYKMDEWKK